jgi:signal peptidase II
VADFLYFHTPVSLGPLSNYVFNIADAAIFVGVMLLLYDSLVSPASGEETAKD